MHEPAPAHRHTACRHACLSSPPTPRQHQGHRGADKDTRGPMHGGATVVLHSGREARSSSRETLEGPGPQELLEDLVEGRGRPLHWRRGQLLCRWGQLQRKRPQTLLRAGAGKGAGRAGACCRRSEYMQAPRSDLHLRPWTAPDAPSPVLRRKQDRSLPPPPRAPVSPTHSGRDPNDEDWTDAHGGPGPTRSPSQALGEARVSVLTCRGPGLPWGNRDGHPQWHRRDNCKPYVRRRKY